MQSGWGYHVFGTLIMAGAMVVAAVLAVVGTLRRESPRVLAPIVLVLAVTVLVMLVNKAVLR